MRRGLSMVALFLACACLLLLAASRAGATGPDRPLAADSFQPLGAECWGLLRFEPDSGRTGSQPQPGRSGAPGSWPVDMSIAVLLALPLWCRSAPLREAPSRAFLQHALIPHSIHAPPARAWRPARGPIHL